METKKILKEYENITRDQCIEWIKNKNKRQGVNPFTGKSIKSTGDRYKIIDEQCSKKYPDLYKNEKNSELIKKSNSIPKKVGKILVPQNLNDWNNIKYTYFKNIYEIMERFKFIFESDYKDFKDFVSVLEIVLDNNIVPESEREYIEEIKDIFEIYLDDNLHYEDNQKRYGIFFITKKDEEVFINRFSKLNDNILMKTIGNIIVSEIKQIISNGVNILNDPYTIQVQRQIKVSIFTVIYNMLIDEINLTKEKIDEKIDNIELIKLYKTYLDFIKEVIEYDKHKMINYSIRGETKSRSLPKSISQKEEIIKVKKGPYQVEVSDEMEPGKKKKKTIIPGINAPEEYNEIKQIIDIPKTDRSTFKSHSKLSNMSNFPEEITLQQLEGKLEKLPDKKRKEILHELKDLCIEMKDPITGIRFDRMNKKNLQLILNIGDKNKEGKQYCFYVRGLYKSWLNQVKNNDIKIKVPITGSEIKQEEKDEILRKMRYIQKDVQNPDTIKLKKDPNVKLSFIPTEDDRFEQIRIDRIYGTYTTLIFSLAYIPVNIELGDLKDAGLTETASADHTSAVLKLYIQSLFDNGGLLTSNFIPYNCCKIHLNPSKDLNYWTEIIPNNKYKDGVNLNRFLHMFNEIKPLITEGMMRNIGM